MEACQKRALSFLLLYLVVFSTLFLATSSSEIFHAVRRGGYSAGESASPSLCRARSDHKALAVRSMCPFSYEIDTDPRRKPVNITVARCQCAKHSCSATAPYECTELLYPMLVQRKQGRKWVNSGQLVSAGCVCALPYSIQAVGSFYRPVGSDGTPVIYNSAPRTIIV